ncbi:DEAD/DEAH box helicase [Acidianus sulfidivorans JP7]|uniref:DNA 3'-5' helicase n=1 Tax=Acidianus sulfidivorans JP7 TaxID=619593 RepID=A0A2U9IQA4_9CREN|nr:DEAD/DEAH box helicase family protein [Acidianus sulfidivorans]AWR98205.1 DEAD/DEAH box helicase [Acidianus sulfidivorans JP7]
MVTLRYFKGLLLSDFYAPGFKWNEELKCYAALGYKYRDTISYFTENDIKIKDNVLDLLPFPDIQEEIRLRKYQIDSLKAWIKAGKRGVIVLPTGAGKTLVALKAISKLKVSTLVIVPTIDLINQWYSAINSHLRFQSGRVGGGYDEIKGITVMTYDSAYSRVEEIGNKFYFVIFDEVHHLPSEGYSQIAEMLIAPYRLGLTATPERQDGKHILLPKLVGPIVYSISASELSGQYLAEFEIKKIYVELTDNEKQLYLMYRKQLENFLNKAKIRLDSLYSFHKLLRLAGRDPKAREALLAWHNAVNIAVNSESKIEKLRELLNKFQNEKIIIFTRDVEMAYRVSKEFLIPVVTYKTQKDERNEILRKFKEGKYRVIVTSSVFDEGVDVPDASIGIILGGYGTSRQMLQRLGRILRKDDNKNKALLIEIVTKGTSDYNLSKRRSHATI